MNIMQFIIGSIVGWIAGSITISPITLLRFNIPMCNKILKSKSEKESAVKLLKKKYYIGLIAELIIITVISLLCCKFLDKGVYGYVMSGIFMVIIGFGCTGINEENMLRFYHNLHCNEEIVTKLDNNDKYIQLSNIIMQGLRVNNVDEALNISYEFYKQQKTNMSNIDLNKNNKHQVLAQLVMLGLETDNIDEAIEKSKIFYKEQEIK